MEYLPFRAGLFTSAKYAQITIEMVNSEGLGSHFFINIFQPIDNGRKTEVAPWIMFKCLNVLLCDPHVLMTN